MPIYTFYCCRPDGFAPSFDAADLPSHRHAAAHADAVLARHESASHVEVRLGDEVVSVQRRLAEVA